VKGLRVESDETGDASATLLTIRKMLEKIAPNTKATKTDFFIVIMVKESLIQLKERQFLTRQLLLYN